MVCSVGSLMLCSPQRETTRVTTFNVELYPKYEDHGLALFEQIRDLDSPVVAVQEVRSARRFRSDANEYLGDTWRYAEANHCDRLCLGLLFDASRVDVLSTRTHRETQIYRGARPVFEAVFEVDDVAITVFVVHLKAKPEGVHIREQQLEALTQVVNKSRPRRTEFVVVGDFNTVTEQDDRLMRRFSSSTGLEWNSADVECSHYWQRETTCITTTLDHVFTSVERASAAPKAACASIGCDIEGACPVYRRQVSDHCPVTIELE